MSSLIVGKLMFDFPDTWRITQYDGWSFYRNQFQKTCGGAKAIDVMAIELRTCLWAIEVKDYRRDRRTQVIDLADEVALKVRDTLAGLIAARANAGERSEQRAARQAIACSRVRVVLHLEQPATGSRLFPRAIDPAKVLQRLKQLVRAIDPHPKVVESSRMAGLAWTVQSQ